MSKENRHGGDGKTSGKGAKKKKRIIASSVIAAVIVVLAVSAVIVYQYRYTLFPQVNIIGSVTIEAGSDLPDVSAFLIREDDRAEVISEFDEETLCTPGTYTVEIQIGKGTYESVLIIADTTPPTATTLDYSGLCGIEVDIDTFIDETYDLTGEVTYEYKEEPDFTLEGDQTVTIILTDEYGNSSEVTATLTLFLDDEAPVIEGVEDQTIYVGDTISYKSGVTVTDNYDEDVELKVDASEVDTSTAGTYTVTYSATDSSGNTATVTATITVEKKTSYTTEYMNELAQEALDACLTDGMDSEEQLYAIFWWVKNHMSYTGTSDKSSYVKAAILGFTNHVGDCYTYFSMMKAMMELAGFETIDVQRINGETNHYWSLVNVDGDWYHIDACPRSASHYSDWLCFLRTDAELEYFSTELVEGYYTFDTSLYPATP